uniref:Coiled-coil domain-containing protein 93 n=1 Tax=Romanomermis culicivorax TaxID=13658 RepID=A0A915JFC8_ROMCU
MEFDVREDELQNAKLEEAVQLLIAAGYFRARIKGIGSFDKIVGGIVWCISFCDFDVDVDLLFQENLNIGQKISLTEKIVRVLTKMKCPHALEPHQIQGLDFIHIFPVIQWLVKKAFEAKKQSEDDVQRLSNYHFHCRFSDKSHMNSASSLLQPGQGIKNILIPQRIYRRKDVDITDRTARIKNTIFEYDGGLQSLSSDTVDTSSKKNDEKKYSPIVNMQRIESIPQNIDDTIADVLAKEVIIAKSEAGITKIGIEKPINSDRMIQNFNEEKLKGRQWFDLKNEIRNVIVPLTLMKIHIIV